MNAVFTISFVFFFRAVNSISTHPLILLVAIDGFGFDYLDRGLTPELQKLKETGSSAKYMYNVFPTVTNPNFFAIATGLYPEINGVIGNHAFNENFTCLSKEEHMDELFHYNEKVTPLWTLNELSGKNRYSGTINYPSSQFVYREHKIEYTGSGNATEKIDQTIKWFLNEDKPANLVFLYFGELDGSGHQYGPNSQQVNETLSEMNELIEYLLHSLTINGLRDKMNLIFLSDHGMLELPPENIVDFNNYLESGTYEACGESPSWQIKYNAGFENKTYENLTKAAQNLGSFNVYRCEEIPERWHVKHNKRQADLLLVANPNYGFADARQFRGDHGYDPDADIKVRSIFIANGPAFKKNYTVEPFSSVDIFPLVASILKLNEPPIKPNGTITFIKNMLKN